MCSTGGNVLVAADRPQMSPKQRRKQSSYFVVLFLLCPRVSSEFILNVSLAQVELHCFFSGEFSAVSVRWRTQALHFPFL